MIDTIPELPAHCNSWIIVDRETGNAILELWTRRLVEQINQDKYEVLTKFDWFVRLNAKTEAERDALDRELTTVVITDDR